MKYLLLLIVLCMSCTKQIKTPLEKLRQLVVVEKFEKGERFKNQLYCYYVYQGVVKPNSITPELFAKYVKGGSLSLKYVSDYKKWLMENEGQSCKALVGEKFRNISVKPDKKYGIYLNNLAIREEGKNPQLTLSHEFMHVAFALYKNNQHRILKRWKSLSDKQQKEFIKAHPGYNFKNRKTLLKEFFSYSFENSPEEGVKFLIE